MKRSLAIIFIGLTSAALLTGCSKSGASDVDLKEQLSKEEEVAGAEEKPSLETKDDETAEEEPAALTGSECDALIEKLINTRTLTPENAELLSEMANCVTLSCVDEPGVLFRDMDNRNKERLRMKFFEEIFYGGSALSEATSDHPDPTEGIPLEEAAEIFKDAYGEKEFIPGEYEDVKDGNLIPSFGAGDAIHVIEHSQIFMDDDHYLLSGPVIRISDYEGDEFERYADILFEKNPDSRYGVTLIYVRYRDEYVSIASVETSSTLPASKNRSYEAGNLIDGDCTTVWVEGVPGTGVGETMTVYLGKKQLVYGVQIISGYTASYKQYSENGVPTEIRAYFGDGVTADGSLEDYYISEDYSPGDLGGCNRIRIEPDKPVMTGTIMITITKVKAGSKYDDTCVSELWVY